MSCMYVYLIFFGTWEISYATESFQSYRCAAFRIILSQKQHEKVIYCNASELRNFATFN